MRAPGTQTRRGAAELSGSRRGHAARALTLVELMVCLGIIAILISMMFPALRNAWEMARAVRCQSNLHQLQTGFLLFAADHEAQLPGGMWDTTDPSPDHRDWLLGDSHDYTTGPERGTLYQYLGGGASVYRCPSLDERPPRKGSFYGTFHGSNGRFDYASVTAFSGARLGTINGTSRFRRPDGEYDMMQTPLIVEKDPLWQNGFALNGAYQDTWTLSHHHHGGSYYVTVTGAAVWFNEPEVPDDLMNGCWRWETQRSVGQWVSLGNFPSHWGHWNQATFP